MRVLSLKEPVATLIYEKKKLVETRSWKTNYRGELYIHASMTKISKSDLEDKELMSLVENKNMNFGNIICKCNLVDCIYMTKEYVEDMKKNNHQEYICGEYSEGRYAWILDDVEPISSIKAKGNLNIWQFYNEFEIMNLMENIEYGWIDRNNNKYNVVDESYLDNYILNAIANYARYNYKKSIDKIKITGDDIIHSIILSNYQKNKNVTKKNIIENYYHKGNNKYVMKSNIRNSIKRINDELEEAANEFHKLFINENDKVL